MNRLFPFVTILLLLSMTACTTEQLPEVSEPAPASSQQEEIKSLKDLNDPRLEQSTEDYLQAFPEEIFSFLPDNSVRFLYITDPDGNPAANIKCCTKAELETLTNQQTVGWDNPLLFSGISMENGLLPVTQWMTGTYSFKNDTQMTPDPEMFRSKEYEMYLVNTESEQPYVQKITVDYTALTEENALSVVWEGPSQEEAAKARDKYFSVVVLDSERQPVSNCFVSVDDNRPKTAEQIGYYSRNDGRYTDDSGTAYFALDHTFSNSFREGISTDLYIELSHFPFETVLPTIHHGIFVDGYQDGELVEKITLIWDEQEVSALQN